MSRFGLRARIDRCLSLETWLPDVATYAPGESDNHIPTRYVDIRRGQTRRDIHRDGTWQEILAVHDAPGISEEDKARLIRALLEDFRRFNRPRPPRPE